MAEISSERRSRLINSDSTLIPHKGDKELFSSWRIALALALIFLVLLPLLKPDPYWKILRFLPDGIFVTFRLTVSAIFCAMILGLVVGLGQISHNRTVNRIATVYVELIRGIPLLVQLFYIYFALGKFLHLEGMLAAVVSMAICYGAYMGEIFRAGFQSIPKGQVEAALALGMSRSMAIRLVVLPQSMRIILPAIGNEFIALLKDSSLVSVLAIADLLRRGREFASTTFLYFESYTMVALIYLLFTLLLSRLVGMLEEKLGEPYGK